MRKQNLHKEETSANIVWFWHHPDVSIFSQVAACYHYVIKRSNSGSIISSQLTIYIPSHRAMHRRFLPSRNREPPLVEDLLTVKPYYQLQIASILPRLTRDCAPVA